MGKKIKTLIGTLAICLAAFSVPVYAKGKDLSFVLPLQAEQGFTSLKFSAEVKNVSENAKVSIDFNKSIPEKTVKKTTYKDGILTVYLAGGEELFPDNTLEIGEITVKNDENNGKDLYVELLPETVEIVNSGYMIVEEIDTVREEIKLTGSGAEAPEEEKPDKEDPDEENPGGGDLEGEDTQKPEMEELKTLLEELKGLDPQNYTQESWNTLSALMEQALELLESETASQEEVTNMVNQLKAAKEGLQPGTPSSEDKEQAKQNLQTLMDELNQLLSSEYTAESWNELYALMKEAKGLLENGGSKLEYDAMTAKLREAQGKLVKVETDQKPETDKKPEGGNGQNGAISGEEVNSQKPQNPIKDTIQGVLTGDNTPVVALALVGILSLAVILGILFSKKMKKK